MPFKFPSIWKQQRPDAARKSGLQSAKKADDGNNSDPSGMTQKIGQETSKQIHISVQCFTPETPGPPAAPLLEVSAVQDPEPCGTQALAILAAKSRVLDVPTTRALRLTHRDIKAAIDKSLNLCITEDKLTALGSSSFARTLQRLTVQGPLSTKACGALVSLSLPKLSSLILDNASDLEKLASGAWPQLKELRVRRAALTQAFSLGSLATTAHWPMLQILVLGGTGDPRGPKDALGNQEATKALSSAFPLLTWLDLRGTAMTKGGVEAFSAAALPHLHHLQLSCHGLMDPGIISLSSANWSNLRALSLSLTTLPVADAQALSSALWIKDLVALKLHCTQNFPAAALRSLLTALSDSSLEELRVGGLSTDASGLLSTARLPNLRLLELGPGAKCRAEGFLPAVCSTHLPNLTHLLIVRTIMDSKIPGWDNIPGIDLPENLPSLSSLHLEGIYLRPSALKKLAAGLLPRLHSLTLSDCDIGDAGIRALMHSVLSHGIWNGRASWPHLQKLSLECNGIGPHSINVLAFASDHFPGLHELDLFGNFLGDEGLLRLGEAAQSGAWPLMRKLYTGNNGAGQEAADALAGLAKGCWRLERLDFGVTRATRPIVLQTLKSAFPKARIT